MLSLPVNNSNGKPGHTFDDCPILNNVDFLRKHCIGFQLFLKRNSVDNVAAPASAATINAVQLDDPSDDTDSSTDEPQKGDFRQGQVH